MNPINAMNPINENKTYKKISIQGPIKSYKRVFQLNYEEIFEKNASKSGSYSLFTIDKRDIVIKKEDLDVYYLECLEILSHDNWNKCFKINYPRKKVELNYPYFGEICCDIQKAFKGTLNFTGENFANSPLIPGDLETYYFQYMAQKIFGSHLAFYGIQNLSDIKKEISKVPKKIISLLQSQNVLKMFYEKFNKKMENEEVRLNEYDLDYSDNEDVEDCPTLFNKGDVIEFSVFIKKPKLELLCSKSLAKKISDKHKSIKIKDSLWKIYFILL
jgi:hypothetical protein